MNKEPFPLFDLPDGILVNVLQRCPVRLIPGFHLPLALAQVRVTGSADSRWLRPLLHVAARCPAVLDHLSRHLRSLEFDPRPSELEAVIPSLSRLERLVLLCDPLPLSGLLLPTGLTKLSLQGLDDSPEAWSSLLRLTAIEDLELWDSRWPRGVLGDSRALLRLRTLKYTGVPPCPTCIRHLAPNLQSATLQAVSEGFPELPETLTELCIVGVPLPPAEALCGLTALERLSLVNGQGADALSEPLSVLTALTALTLCRRLMNSDVSALVDAMESAGCRAAVHLELAEVAVGESSEELGRLFPYLADLRRLSLQPGGTIPWAALTRLTRLLLEVDGSEDASWVQPLSQLPNLRDLELSLACGIPPGLGVLAHRSTKLVLTAVDHTPNLSGVQQLTRLRECDTRDVSVDCLEALPPSLTYLNACGAIFSCTSPLGRAVQHLTALEHLELHWPSGLREPSDLSALQRLTQLVVSFAPCPLLTIASLRCLQVLRLESCKGLGDVFVQQQVTGLCSLRVLGLEPCLRSAAAAFLEVRCRSR